MAHEIDYSKLSRIETPYGNGYAYGGTIYSDKQWKDILDFNAGGFADDNDPNTYFSNSPRKHKEISKEKFDRMSSRYLNQEGSESLGSTTSPANQIISGRNPNKSVSRSNMDGVNKFIMSPNIDMQPRSLDFKRGGPKEGEMSDAENKAYNLEMGIDDASVRADEAAINASKDALEQSYSDKNDAAEPDRIARYSSASDESDARDARMEEGRYLAARNQARREANPVSEQVSRGTGVAKGFFDETGDAENAPISLINNQTTNKKPVQEIIKKPKEGETNYPTRKDKTEPYVGSDGLPTTIRGFGSDQETLDGYNNPESNPNIDPFISKLKESYKQPNNPNAGSSFTDAMKSSAAFKLFEKQAKIDFEKAKKQKEIDESNRAQKAYYNNPGIGNFLNSK